MVDLDRSQAPLGHVLSLAETESGAARLDGGQAQKALNEARQRPEVRAFLEGRLAQIEANVNEGLDRMEPPAGTVLLEAEMPFPSADRSLLRLGDFEIPTGLKGLD